MSKNTNKFWLQKSYTEFSKEEWESICDRCGRCCVNKIEYEDINQIHYTDVACKQLDCTTAQCKDYPNRQKIVPDCLQITPESLASMTCLPDSCSYRKIANGEDLADWHPLKTGNPNSTEDAGMSVKNLVVPEDKITDDLEDHLIDWIPVIEL